MVRRVRVLAIVSLAWRGWLSMNLRVVCGDLNSFFFCESLRINNCYSIIYL